MELSKINCLGTGSKYASKSDQFFCLCLCVYSRRKRFQNVGSKNIYSQIFLQLDISRNRIRPTIDPKLNNSPRASSVRYFGNSDKFMLLNSQDDTECGMLLELQSSCTIFIKWSLHVTAWGHWRPSAYRTVVSTFGSLVKRCWITPVDIQFRTTIISGEHINWSKFVQRPSLVYHLQHLCPKLTVTNAKA